MTDVSLKEIQLAKARFDAALAKLTSIEAADVRDYVALSIKTSYDKGLEDGIHIQLKDAYGMA